MNETWWYVMRHNDRSSYHFDSNKLIANIRLWSEKFPGIQPYYAVKCNNCPLILRLLKEHNFSFDCASQRELELVRSLDVPISSLHPSLHGVGQLYVPSVIYANPCKFPTHLEWTHQNNVKIMTADCPEELEKISHLCPSAQVVLRIAVDDSHSMCKFNSKFGLVPTEDNLHRFFNKVKILQLSVIGVSFHVGSGCLSEKSYEDALKKCRNVFDFALQKFGLTLEVIDLGGGFIQNEPLLTNVSKTILQQLKILFNWQPGDCYPLVIAEPGRFMVTNVFDLYVQVIGKKLDVQVIKYYVNNTVYGAFNCKIFDYATFTYTFYTSTGQPLTLTPTTCKYSSTIFGATCDSVDKILENVEIPELEVGFYICFHNMGAYTYSSSTEFNGIPLAQVVSS